MANLADIPQVGGFFLAEDRLLNDGLEQLLNDFLVELLVNGDAGEPL